MLFRSVSGLSGIDHGLSYLYLDRDGLIEHCGHYLIYGSEHICGIAAGLMRERRSDFPDYRQVLKRFGRPAIIRFSVPVGKLDDSDLDELARDALLPVTPRLRAGRKPPDVNFTFTVSNPLPASCVVGHEYPTTIPDPLFPFRPEYKPDEPLGQWPYILKV